MKSEITISELAKLMNVSVHQIRYFEEKGVLRPAYTGENQYRMYGIDQVYRLAHILLLRKLGVPVQSIEERLNSSADQQRQLLSHSLQGIEQELLRLQELRQFILKVLQEEQSFSSQYGQFMIQNHTATFLSRIMKLDPHMKLSAALLAEQAKGIPDIFETDIHYLYDGVSITLYVATQAPGDASIPDGQYLTWQCVAQEDELEQRIEQFYDYAAAQSVLLLGPLVVIERSYLSLFVPDKLHYELKALIGPTPPLDGEHSV